MILKITVGEHQVEVTVDQLAPNVVELTAVCGQTVRKGPLTLHPQHDRTGDSLQKDIQDLAQTLASEAAGHEQSRKLIANLFTA
jgi:hypothetical protein